jgi:hypothetical protein
MASAAAGPCPCRIRVSDPFIGQPSMQAALIPAVGVLVSSSPVFHRFLPDSFPPPSHNLKVLLRSTYTRDSYNLEPCSCRLTGHLPPHCYIQLACPALDPRRDVDSTSLQRFPWPPLPVHLWGMYQVSKVNAAGAGKKSRRTTTDPPRPIARVACSPSIHPSASLPCIPVFTGLALNIRLRPPQPRESLWLSRAPSSLAPFLVPASCPPVSPALEPTPHAPVP